MNEIKDKELMNIAGGFNLSASFVSAVSKAYNYIYSLGQSAGSTIRRMISGSYCGL